MKLEVTKDTIFKTKPVPSDRLLPAEKLSVRPGAIDITEFEDAAEGHVFVTCTLPQGDRREWYVYTGHIKQLTESDHPAEQDDNEPDPKVDQGASFLLLGERKFLNEPIVKGGNFTWAEATKGGTRVPKEKSLVNGIIRIATSLEEVRSQLGDRPIKINSWYRPPAVNRAVGGASKSRHMIAADAVDIVVVGMTPQQVQARLNSTWRGGLGRGKTFTHLDKRGYDSRFNYGR